MAMQEIDVLVSEVGPRDGLQNVTQTIKGFAPASGPRSAA
jgi:hypothetical protein